MSRFHYSVAVILAAASTLAVAQTWTACNPLNSTTCPKDEALGTSYQWNWTSGDAADTKVWNTTAGSIDWTTEGAKFIINEQGDSPTIQSNFYIFFGQVSVVMTAAKGQGIISSIVLESDDLDEVDWEFIGGNTTSVETNYFGKGNTTSYDRAIYYGVDDPQNNFHNYTTVWTSASIEWFIDGVLARTLLYADAVGGKNFPQTPMNLRLGIWAGGDPTEPEGVIEWAGGKTDFSDAPFTMTVQSVFVQDYSTGSSYSYGDTSGDWQSIKIASGNSTIYKALTTDSKSTTLQKAKALKTKYLTLPPWARITIACTVLGVCALIATALTLYCLRRRKAGFRELARQQQEYEKLQMETLMARQKGFEGGNVGGGFDDGEGGDFSYKGGYHEVPKAAAMGGRGRYV